MPKPLVKLAAALEPAPNCGVCAAETIKELENPKLSSLVIPICRERKHEQGAKTPCLADGCKITESHSHIASPQQRDLITKLSKSKPSAHLCADANCSHDVVSAAFKRSGLFAALESLGSPETSASPSPARATKLAVSLADTASSLRSPAQISSHSCGPACSHSAPSDKVTSAPHVHNQNLLAKYSHSAEHKHDTDHVHGEHCNHEDGPAVIDGWQGIAALIEKHIKNPVLQKLVYLSSSIAAATPFGELFAAFSLPETAAKLLSPLMGVSLMQGLMHGSAKLSKFFWTLPVVGLSGLASLANIPRILRRVVTVALLQIVDSMQDHKSKLLSLDHFMLRLKDKSKRQQFLQVLAKVEIAINSSIPFANFCRRQVEAKINNRFGKRMIGWFTWLATLIAGIMGLDIVGDKLIAFANKRNSKSEQELVSKEAALACGSCGGMHVEVACPTVIAEESALAAVA